MSWLRPSPGRYAKHETILDKRSPMAAPKTLNTLSNIFKSDTIKLYDIK